MNQKIFLPKRKSSFLRTSIPLNHRKFELIIVHPNYVQNFKHLVRQAVWYTLLFYWILTIFGCAFQSWFSFIMMWYILLDIWFANHISFISGLYFQHILSRNKCWFFMNPTCLFHVFSHFIRTRQIHQKRAVFELFFVVPVSISTVPLLMFSIC